jgi:hypothetical protein
MNQDPPTVHGTACLTLFVFSSAYVLWLMVLGTPAFGGVISHDVGVALASGLPLLAWGGLAVVGLARGRQSTRAAGIAAAALILPFFCAASWWVILTFLAGD